MSRQFWSEAITWLTADGTAVASTASETILPGNVTIPANYLQDGRSFRIRAFGKYSTTGAPTITFRLRWGGVAGTLICASAAVTTQTGVTNAGFDLDIVVTTRSNGSSATVMGNGTARVFANVATTVATSTGNAGITPMMNGGTVTPATATIDATSDTQLALTLQWSASSASNTATILNYTIEALN